MFAVALLAAVGQRPDPGGDAHPARHLRPPEQRRPAPGQPGRDHQRDPQRLPGARQPAAAVGGAQLPRLGGAQLPRRDQPLPRLLGRQPDHADPAVTAGLRPAVRRDDGRRRTDPGPGPASSSTPASTGWPRRSSTSSCYAEPDNAEARRLLADAFEQFGYQQESPSVRNSFLAAALELRSGIPDRGRPEEQRPGHDPGAEHRPVPGLPGHPAGHAPRPPGRVHRSTSSPPTTASSYVVELSNGTLTNLAGFLAEDPDLTHHDQPVRPRGSR